MTNPSAPPPAQPRPEIKRLFKRFLDLDLSRRQFLAKLTALGVSAPTAQAFAQEFAPFVTRPGEPVGEDLPSWARPLHGTGGQLLVAQLEAAGMKYLFVSPSSGEAPVFDAMVDSRQLTLVEAIHEGALVAMADGYARVSATTPFVMCSRVGLSNGLTQLFNSWTDRIPLVLMIDGEPTARAGHDGFEALDDFTALAAPLVKWRWRVEATAKVPEVTRRAVKFASTHPRRPAFLEYPEDVLARSADSAIMDQRLFSVSMKIRPDPEALQRAARLLAHAANPLLCVGNEVRVAALSPSCSRWHNSSARPWRFRKHGASTSPQTTL
jgi:TPP-dependent 2-oxoacid decarboxylase